MYYILSINYYPFNISYDNNQPVYPHKQHNCHSKLKLSIDLPIMLFEEKCLSLEAGGSKTTEQQNDFVFDMFKMC